jgi:hypothetical protein
MAHHYQCVGLARLVEGDFEESIGYLQQSSRMCKEGVPSLTALSNLAGAHWWRATSKHFSKHGLLIEDEGGPTVASSTAKATGNALVDMSELDEAISYFIEVVDIANGEEGTNTEGLSDWTSCTTPVPKNKKDADSNNSNNNDKAGGEGEQGSSQDNTDYLNRIELLKANAMAGIGSSKMFYEKIEAINESSDAMLAALTTSTPLCAATKELKGMNSLVNFNNAQYESVVFANLIQVRAFTILGKQKHNTGLPVSAEGLYRSAISTFETLEPTRNKKQNAMGLFEKWQLLLCYESLLKKWENREGDAAKMKVRARDVLTELLVHRGETKGAPLFSTLLVTPTLQDVGQDMSKHLVK